MRRIAIGAIALLLTACTATTSGYQPTAPRKINPEVFEPVVVPPSATPTASITFRVRKTAGTIVKPKPKPITDPKAYARSRLGSKQYQCLLLLWNKESGWNHLSMNKSSGAYGIPQALPGSKMASAGKDWRTNPITQVKWGLGYVNGRYGSACGAWRFWQSNHWY